MKKLILVLFTAFAVSNSYAQSSAITEVVPVEGASKTELYNRAKLWFAKTFKSAKDVIQLDDKENGQIIGNGAISYSAPAGIPGYNFSGYFYFTVTVEVKDNRFKYTFENFRHEANKDGYSGGSFEIEKPSGLFFTKGGWRKIKDQCYEDIYAAAAKLKAAMSVKAGNSDW